MDVTYETFTTTKIIDPSRPSACPNFPVSGVLPHASDPLNPRKPLICLLLLYIMRNFLEFYVNETTQCLLFLCLLSFTQHCDIEIHPYCSMDTI